MLVDTAPVERKERLIKSAITDLPKCDASKNINIHITTAVNLTQLDEMEFGQSLGSLVGRTTRVDLSNDGFQGNCARSCKTSLGLTLTAGDVLLVDAVPHLLRACLKLDDGRLNFLVQPCRLLRTQGAGKLWSLLAEHVLVQEPDDSQYCCVCYFYLGILWLLQGCLVERLHNPFLLSIFHQPKEGAIKLPALWRWDVQHGRPAVLFCIG